MGLSVTVLLLKRNTQPYFKLSILWDIFHCQSRYSMIFFCNYMYFRMLVAVVFDFVTCADLALSYFSIPILVNDKWHGLNWKILEIKQAQGCGEAITLYNISRHFEFGSVWKPVKILYTCSFPTIVTVLVYYRCNVVKRFIYPVVL